MQGTKITYSSALKNRVMCGHLERLHTRTRPFSAPSKSIERPSLAPVASRFARRIEDVAFLHCTWQFEKYIQIIDSFLEL